MEKGNLLSAKAYSLLPSWHNDVYKFLWVDFGTKMTCFKFLVMIINFKFTDILGFFLFIGLVIMQAC